MRDESLTLEMNLGGANSRYVLGPLAGLELGRFTTAGPPVYIVDQAVAEMHPHWLEQIEESCPSCERNHLLLAGGEETKSLAILAHTYEWLAEVALPREGTIVGIGGGSVLDLAATAAATWRRGVNFVALPTTLVAMVDAAIGGKTAVNAAGLKNPVGCFHAASGILADCGFLATLPLREWRNGMAELVKTAVVGDESLFRDLHEALPKLHTLLGGGPDDEPVPGILGGLPWRDWIGRAAAVKARIVTRDFKEAGLRRSLNLGHTLGHVLEAWAVDHGIPLDHGRAVSVGMAVVFRIATERGTCPLPVTVRLVELLEACGLPTYWPAPPATDLERLLRGDKKQSARAGLRWVLPERIGKMDLDGKVTPREVLKWLSPID